jgi:quinol monooxygenase YgiN
MAQETWVRVVIYENTSGDPEAAEKFLKHTADNVLRVFEKTKGCKNGYWAVDPDSGRIAAITYWEGPEAIQAAKSTLAQVHEERESGGLKLVSEENFMVRKRGQFASPW